MDCEKFDRVMLDLFYDELDDITSAAARRHTEHCTRCRDISTKLRAARDVGAVPLVDPPSDLEAKILAAERRARAELPAAKRLGRAISMLAGYAMRPQLAMAALLLLVIGSSLVLLRARPGEQKNVLVTERGVPESESEAAAPLHERQDEVRRLARPAQSLPPARAVAPSGPRESAAKEAPEEGESLSAKQAVETDRSYEDALGAYRDRRYDDAQTRFEQLAARGGDKAPSAALYAAQAARARSGCPTAAVLFERVYQQFPESPPGHEAAWQAASCYRALGDFERARYHYDAVLRAPGYGDRAQAALASMGEEPSEIAARRAAQGAPAGRAAPAAAAAPATGGATAPAKAGSREPKAPPDAPTP